MTPETKKELEQVIKETIKTIESLRKYIFECKNLSKKLWEQINSRNLEITSKIEKITEKIEKEQKQNEK